MAPSKELLETDRKFKFSSGESAVAAGGKRNLSAWQRQTQTALEFMNNTNGNMPVTDFSVFSGLD